MDDSKRVRPVRPDDVAEVIRWCTLGPDRAPHQNMTRNVNVCNAAGRIVNNFQYLAPDLWKEVLGKLAERVLDGRIDPNVSDDHPAIGERSTVLPAREIKVGIPTRVQWEKDHWIAWAVGNEKVQGAGITRDEAVRDLEIKINQRN